MINKNKKGFTIIEVVLVLAIAGLIFLMVFIALPALQRSQRNTRRRQDMARIISAVNDYQANNNNKLPFDSEDDFHEFVMKYVDSNCKNSSGNYDGDLCGEQFKDPDGSTYLYWSNGESDSDTYEGYGKGWLISNPTMNHQIKAYSGGECSGREEFVKESSGNNMFALVYILEGGAVYCGDNQ